MYRLLTVKIHREALPAPASAPGAGSIRLGRSARASVGSGFTIIEMLIALAIVVILVSIVIVAMNFASRQARVSSTAMLMQTMTQALTRFKEDHGYLPPALDLDRAPIDPPNPQDMAPEPYSQNAQDYFSITTLAEYLIGYGHARQVGYGAVPEEHGGNDIPWTEHADEIPPLGIRSPGPDGVWNAALLELPWSPEHLGRKTNRVEGRRVDGRVYGPYIELPSARSLGRLNPQDPHSPMVILDDWDQPIRYYRLPHTRVSPSQVYRSRIVNGTRIGTLADVFLLRPQQVNSDDAVQNIFPDESGRTVASRQLLSAEFGLFSSGPSGRFDPLSTVDANELNRDNIVETGP